MLLVHGPDHLAKPLERNTVQLFLAAADCDGYCSLLNFLIADDNDVRNLVEAELLDLGVHVLVIAVADYSDTHIHEHILDLFRVLVVLLADRNNADLSCGHPERESALVVLDQNTHKSLEGSEYRAVDNDRLLLEAVAVTVCKTEVMRQLEVELYSDRRMRRRLR